MQELRRTLYKNKQLSISYEINHITMEENCFLRTAVAFNLCEEEPMESFGLLPKPRRAMRLFEQEVQKLFKKDTPSNIYAIDMPKLNAITHTAMQEAGIVDRYEIKIDFEENQFEQAAYSMWYYITLQDIEVAVRDKSIINDLYYQVHGTEMV